MGFFPSKIRYLNMYIKLSLNMIEYPKFFSSTKLFFAVASFKGIGTVDLVEARNTYFSVLFLEQS